MIEQVPSTLVKEIFVGFDGTVTRVRDTPQIYTPNAMIKNKRTNQNTYGDFFDALDENTISLSIIMFLMQTKMVTRHHFIELAVLS